MAVATRRIFAEYEPAPLNDLAAPPFPGREADDEDDTPAGRHRPRVRAPEARLGADRAGARRPTTCPCGSSTARSSRRRSARWSSASGAGRSSPLRCRRRRSRSTGAHCDARRRRADAQGALRLLRRHRRGTTCSRRSHALREHRRRPARPADRAPCHRRLRHDAPRARAASRWRRWRRRSAT